MLISFICVVVLVEGSPGSLWMIIIIIIVLIVVLVDDIHGLLWMLIIIVVVVALVDASPGSLWMLNNWVLYPGNEDVMEPVVTIADLIHNITPQARVILIFRNPTER